MRVFIAGVDGYLGWALAQYLIARRHEVAGCDLYLRRDWVAEMGSQSATPIRRMTERLQAFRENFGTNLRFIRGNVIDYHFVWNFLRAFKPDAIVHLAEMPSAPYSMIDVHHCAIATIGDYLKRQACGRAVASQWIFRAGQLAHDCTAVAGHDHPLATQFAIGCQSLFAYFAEIGKRTLCAAQIGHGHGRQLHPVEFFGRESDRHSQHRAENACVSQHSPKRLALTKRFDFHA